MFWEREREEDAPGGRRRDREGGRERGSLLWYLTPAVSERCGRPAQGLPILGDYGKRMDRDKCAGTFAMLRGAKRFYSFYLCNAIGLMLNFGVTLHVCMFVCLSVCVCVPPDPYPVVVPFAPRATPLSLGVAVYGRDIIKRPVRRAA